MAYDLAVVHSTPEMDRSSSRGSLFSSRNSITPLATPLGEKAPCPRKVVFRSWCENSTLHGIVDWYNGGSFARWFWALLVLSFVAMAAYQIHGLVDAFNTYPYYTSTVYLKETKSADFPNVTVCNMNRINKTKAAEINLTADAISLMFLSQVALYDIETLSGGPGGNPLPVLGKHMQAWNEFWPTSGYKDLAELFVDMGHICQETFFQCKFGGPYFDCCKHAKPVLNAEYGLCWSLTPPIQEGQKMPQQYFPGVTMGLKMYLSPGLQYYSNDVFFNNYLEQGLLVVASNNPYEFWFKDRLIVQPGSHASIHLHNKIFNFKRPLFKVFEPDCAENVTTKYTKGNYSLLNCMADCPQTIANDKCKCYMIGEVKNKENPACTPDQVMTCLYPKLFKGMEAMAKNVDSNELASCMAKCKSPCENRKEVTMTSSISKFPSPEHVEHFQDFYEEVSPQLMGFKFRPPKEFVKSWIVVDLYFTERGYTVVESQAKIAIFTLVGNIGGQLGLWLGASILTVIQLSYYLIMYIVPWCTPRKIEED